MNSKEENQLASELQDVGAGSSEAKTLAMLASSLHELNGEEPEFARSLAETSALFRPKRQGLRTLIAGLSTVGVLALGFITVSIAQTAFPGTLLYPVKRLTENVAVIAQPNYRGILMMRRAQEVKQLVALKQSPRLIDTTLQSYKTEVAHYKNGNYADYEYCESTLLQAENMSSGADRLAIAETIASVKNESD